MSPADVSEFQKGRYDWLGHPLKQDGALGPKTLWAMAVAKLDPRRQAIVARACGCVGMGETRGTNRSPDIDAWLERCGAALGSPWCAAFASWCLSVRDMPLTRQAGAQALGKSFPVTLSPEPGDVMWFPTGDWTGHCGIVVGVGIDEVATVEGNNNNAVRCVRRPRRDVRYAMPLTHETSHPVPVPRGLALDPVTIVGTR